MEHRASLSIEFTVTSSVEKKTCNLSVPKYLSFDFFNKINNQN
jgi:hypothetical protein